MKIATWNINSVRHRIGLVSRFLRDQQPDVLALQETKVVNELFPAEPLRKLGYVHQAIHGQKAYHGVAILSRLPFRKTGSQDFCREGHARHIGVTFENGVALHNFYVPAGGDIPDPGRNEKFAHKLHFLGAMEKFFARRAKAKNDPVMILGDFNVAPLEHDVWSHKQLLDVVSHTPVEDGSDPVCTDSSIRSASISSRRSNPSTKSCALTSSRSASETWITRSQA
jgi:exodeoxyribonuclease-3